MRGRKDNLRSIFIMLAFALSLPVSFANAMGLINRSDEVNFLMVNADEVLPSDPLSDSVVLLVNQGKSEICTATIISNQVLLTAAHCVQGKPEDLAIYSGVRPFSENEPISLEIQAVLPHPDFEKEKPETWQKDIALIYLKEDATALGFRPIDLAKELPPILAVLGAGYGIGNSRNESVQVVRDSELEDSVLRSKILKIDEVQNIESSFFEVIQGEGGLCSGDSGGPALQKRRGRYSIVGIAQSILWDTKVEAPSQLQRCSARARYLKIQAVYDWIQAHL